MMRRSSSVRPLGSFHVAMSRDMLISCGIQWLAQVARYFSHAHLYLNGTSWLTSVWPLMMRLSATLTRACSRAASWRRGDCESVQVTLLGRPRVGERSALRVMLRGLRGARRVASSASDVRLPRPACVRVLPVRANYESVACEHQALLDIRALALLRLASHRRCEPRRIAHASHITDTLRSRVVDRAELDVGRRLPRCESARALARPPHRARHAAAC